MITVSNYKLAANTNFDSTDHGHGRAARMVSRCEMLCAWNRDDQIRTLSRQDRSRTWRTGGAARAQGRREELQSRTSRCSPAEISTSQCDGWAEDPPANRPDRNPRDQRLQRMRHRSTAFREAYMSVASGMYDISMAVGVEQMGKQGPARRHWRRRPGVLDRRQKSVRASCLRFSARRVSSICANTAPRWSTSRKSR